MTQIASIRKNAREVLLVELGEFKGHNLLSLRVWVGRGDGPEPLTPTKKGVTVSVALLPAIRKAFQDAEAEAISLGLMPEVQA